MFAFEELLLNMLDWFGDDCNIRSSVSSGSMFDFDCIKPQWLMLEKWMWLSRFCKCFVWTVY